MSGRKQVSKQTSVASVDFLDPTWCPISINACVCVCHCHSSKLREMGTTPGFCRTKNVNLQALPDQKCQMPSSSGMNTSKTMVLCSYFLVSGSLFQPVLSRIAKQIAFERAHLQALYVFSYECSIVRQESNTKRVKSTLYLPDISFAFSVYMKVAVAMAVASSQ